MDRDSGKGKVSISIFYLINIGRYPPLSQGQTYIDGVSSCYASDHKDGQNLKPLSDLVNNVYAGRFGKP